MAKREHPKVKGFVRLLALRSLWAFLVIAEIANSRTRLSSYWIRLSLHIGNLILRMALLKIGVTRVLLKRSIDL